MEKETSLDLLSCRAFSGLCRQFRKFRLPFLSTMGIGLFCYLFMFTNKLLTHDDLGNMFDKGATVTSGRWGLDILAKILPNYSIPWFHGLITLILISVAVCVIIHLLAIRKPLLQVLTGGLIVSFPSLIGTFGYMFTSSSYGVSFLLAVLGAWAFSHRGFKWTISGLLFCTFSLSIYQAYIPLTGCLLVLVLIRRTLSTEDPVKNIFLQGVYFLLCLGASMVLYWIATRLIQMAVGSDMSNYVDIALEGQGGILSRISDCIRALAYILLLGYKGLVHEGLVQVLHLLCGLLIGLELLHWCCSGRKWDRIAMLVFLLVVFPFTLTGVLLFTAMSSAHSLVYYGFVGIYILAALVIECCSGIPGRKPLHNRLRALGMNLTVLAMAIIVYSNCAIANQAYLNLHMRYENNYRTATSLLTRIETTPGFTQDMPVAVIGGLPVTVDLDRIYDVNHITGVSEQATRNWDLKLFLRYYCGAEYNFLTQQDSFPFIDTPEFQEMNFYPEENSIRIIDGTMVLKMDPWQLPEEFIARIIPQS